MAEEIGEAEGGDCVIKAIETRYSGYRFRSRLEARWAVFFDALGLRYEYEKEGYEIRGKAYLPDFWMLDLGIFIEIKGQEPTDLEYDLCRLLHWDIGPPVLLVWGLPKDFESSHIFYVTAISGDGGGHYEDQDCHWQFCRNCKMFFVWTSGYESLWDGDFRETWQGCQCGDPVGRAWMQVEMSEAYKIATEARFEHGEKGASR